MKFFLCQIKIFKYLNILCIENLPWLNPLHAQFPFTERCDGDETYSSEEASTESEITMQSDASFSGMEQKHSDESSYEMSSENKINEKVVLRSI